MITYTSNGGRIYECDICHESIGYCGPGDDERFLEDLITIKGDNNFSDSHVHSKCFDCVVAKIEEIAERRKNVNRS